MIGRGKILASFAFFGFLVGAASYLIFDWMLTTKVLNVTYVPLMNVVSAPWLLSGLAGSILAVIVVIALSYLTPKR